MDAGPASPKSQRTREEFLDAARRVVARKGFLNATIAEIAREAGRAPGTFYLYFPSKLALAYELARQFDAAAAGGSARSDPTLERRVEADIEAAVEQFWRTFSEQLAIVVGAYQLSLVEPAFTEEWNGIRRRVARRFQAGMERTQAHRIPSDKDCLPEASAVSGMLFHTALVRKFLEPGDDVPQADEHIKEALARLWSAAVAGPGEWGQPG